MLCCQILGILTVHPADHSSSTGDCPQRRLRSFSALRTGKASGCIVCPLSAARNAIVKVLSYALVLLSNTSL